MAEHSAAYSINDDDLVDEAIDRTDGGRVCVAPGPNGFQSLTKIGRIGSP